MLRAIDYARKHSSLTWFDYLWCRALSNFKGENYLSLENADMAYLLKLNEYLDVQDFISDVNDKEETAKANSSRAGNKNRGRRG